MWLQGCLVLLGFLFFLPQAEAQNEDAQGKFWVVASRNNVEQFRRYYCKWRETRATAKDLKCALAGQLENRRVCEHALACDTQRERRERYQCLAPVPSRQNAEKVGDTLVLTVEYLPVTQLRGPESEGTLTAGTWNDFRLRAKEYWHERQGLGPLSLGMFYRDNDRDAPWSLLTDVTNGRAKLESATQVVSEAGPLLNVVFSRSWGTWEFSFDPAMGYLPRVSSYSTFGSEGKKVAKQTVKVITAKEFPAKGWFPMHLRDIRPPIDPQASVEVFELEVLELRLDDEVVDADFQLELPAGTTILRDMPSAQWRSFKLRQREVITADDLPTLEKMMERVGQPLAAASKPQPDHIRVTMDTAIPRNETPWLTWSLLAGGVGLAAGAAIVAFRRRRLSIERAPETLPGTG